jgi:hypothetical protein
MAGLGGAKTKTQADSDQLVEASQVLSGGAQVGAKNEALFSGRVPPCSPKRTRAEKDGAQPLPALLLPGQKDRGQEEDSSCNGVEAFEKSVFGPCTLGRTWGTRPEPKTLVGRFNPLELSCRSPAPAGREIIFRFSCKFLKTARSPVRRAAIPPVGGLPGECA